MKYAVLIIALFFGVPATAEITLEDSNSVFVSAVRAYDDGHYGHAATLFETVLALQPDCARCAHMLGKSYGRLAEQADWTQALQLANKTRVALEQAVQLAPHDPEAVRDLIRYYRAAPGFLGGDKEKARLLEQRLREAQAGHTG